tara:strand:- start:383 stop:766 length:384 start_codon:yes stop_codon:yes gene_type:complete
MNSQLVLMDKLFINGISFFNEKKYYEAHESWEDLWSDYYLPDANFIQGLIQLSVGYFHITNLNINGAIGLLTKSIKKLTPYSPKCRSINVDILIDSATRSLDNLSNIDCVKNFDWSTAPKIIFINEK